jgi:hypothetical protein
VAVIRHLHKVSHCGPGRFSGMINGKSALMRYT